MTSTVSDYNILKMIGAGSFGTCFKIQKKSTGEIFVWKAIDYGKMSEEKKKFLVSEVNLLSNLDHRHIVKYLDRIIHQPTTTIYIVMEWCEGGDLSTLISQCKRTNKKFEERSVWRILYQLSCALQLCHSLLPEGPVLHRDIKPANVFLDGNGNVKLGDFGLAYLLQEGQSTVFTTSVVGTPFYMSPEVLQNSLYSEKSDIWSLGCLIYELCSLAPPFDGSDLHQLIRVVQEGRFTKISPEYSDDLHEIISLMLTVDHHSRPNVDVILHHPQVIMHLVQESLEEIDCKSCCSGDKTGQEHKDSNQHRQPTSQAAHVFMQECNLHAKFEELKDWENILSRKEQKLEGKAKNLTKLENRIRELESMLALREQKLEEKSRILNKREIHINELENTFMKRMSQVENFIQNCQNQYNKKSFSHKSESLCNSERKLSVVTDESDTSFTLPTSAKLNPQIVEKPAVFTRVHSEKRVHFGTLPNIKNKCISKSENSSEMCSGRSISHILIDGLSSQGHPAAKTSQINWERNTKLKTNKIKLSCAIGDETAKSSSSTSGISGPFMLDDERRLWLEQKRFQFLRQNKENILANNSQTAPPYHGTVKNRLILSKGIIK